MPERILIVDDEKLIRWALRKNLAGAGYDVLEAEDGNRALAILEEDGADLILLDIRMPGKDGLQVLEHVVEHHSQIPVILMTAYSTVEGAVDAMKQGAFHYLVKPFNLDEVLLVTRKALDTTRLRRELVRVRQQQQQMYGTGNLIGKSEKMRKIFDLIHKVATSAAATVLIQGESGTGKDLVANAIHYTSDRADKPFVNITCSALPETLLESELMGYEKGAFTDARERKRGLFEVADGGTLFLDEIGDMGPSLQAKLLRFLEEKAFRRVGGSVDLKVDVRIIAATNRNLEEAVQDGSFRADLYYRLKVVPIEMPTLRARREDIPLLVSHFLERFNGEFRKKTQGCTPEAMELLTRYQWPGNVRELRNVTERAMILENKKFLGAEDFPALDEVSAADSGAEPAPPGQFRLPEEGYGLHQMEVDMVRQALAMTGGNQSQAAILLDISRDALRYRMGKMGLL